MTTAAVIEIPPADARYVVGTLRYTKAGLLTLFLWMLWGDFCFTMMELIIPKLLPIQLQSLGASNLMIGLLTGSIANAMNMVVVPVVSFRSDRYRSRWGRRIPFLFWPTPFITLFLILLGFSDSISQWLQSGSVVQHLGLSATAAALTLVAVLVLCFQFFNMFVASVYYYLFNDVVPQAFLGRFMAMFRVIGMLAGFFFHRYIFGWASTHMTEVYVGVSLLYFAAFMLMCWRVKEGQYPPPPAGDQPGLWGNIKTYFRDCYSQPYYLCFYMAVTLWNMSGAAVTFMVFFADGLGMSRDDFGKVMGWTSLLSAALLYPFGMLVDRLHPLRVALIAGAITAPSQLIYVFLVHSPQSYFIALMCVMPIGVLYLAASLPMMMALLPKDRYGQFCSAQAVMGSVGQMAAAVLAGLLIDVMGNNYRYLYVWMFLCQSLAIAFLFIVYRMWRRGRGAASTSPHQ